jgi:hypothetical protein
VSKEGGIRAPQVHTPLSDLGNGKNRGKRNVEDDTLHGSRSVGLSKRPGRRYSLHKPSIPLVGYSGASENEVALLAYFPNLAPDSGRRRTTS